MSSSEEDDLDAPTISRKKFTGRVASRDTAVHQQIATYDTSSPTEDATDPEAFGDKGPTRKRRRNKIDDVTRLRWSDDDGEDVGAAAYKRFKARKPELRKRAAASTRAAKAVMAQRKVKPSEGHTGVGKQRLSKPRMQRIPTYGDASSDEELMEWTVPDYLQQRRRKFNERTQTLREGGLVLPPDYDNVGFTDDDNLEHLRERPSFAAAKTLAPYQDVELPYSRGVIPASIAQYLRGYQVEGVTFLHELFVYQRGGILGDDMGLGKTVQIIAFLTAAYGKTGDERDDKRMRKMRKKGHWYPRTLVICPGSLMANWQDEFQRWGWWHVDLYHGAQKEDVLEAASAGMIEVMITTYTTYQKNKGHINTVKWDCVVADECHIVKNHRAGITIAMNEVNALCRIGLTGTAIQNKYEELWTLLNWTSPGQLGPLSTWRTSVSEPLKLGQSHNATVYELARGRKTARKLVENLLPDFFRRRMKTLIKDQLPKKTDRVVFCPLTETQADAYQNFLDSEFVQRIKTSGDMCDCRSGKKAGWCCYMFLEDGSTWQSWVFPALTTLQKLSNHLALVIPSGNDSRDKQAKDLDLLQIAVPNQWKKLNGMRDNMLNSSNPEFCGKWRILKKLLKFWHDQGDNKVLIFSHSVRLLRMLHDLFMSSSYNVKYLDGSLKYEERYATVQEFNADPTQFVFLISTRAGGVGLNITSANKVVVVDPNWNPSYDLQAQDRAYRIGQTRDVEVYRLVSQGTLEEIVYARQIYKQQQANIGYNATEERRYFQGVQDRRDQKGEIFGLQNLFAYQHENVVLRDIVNKTNVAESRADVRVANLELDEDDDNQNTHDDEDAVRSDDNLDKPSIKTEGEDREDAAISQLAAHIKGETDVLPGRHNKMSKMPTKSPTASFLSSNSDNNTQDPTRRDPIQAILSRAGVTYTHENSEVIGTSRVEARLSKRAERAADAESEAHQWHQGPTTKVFMDESQSQSQSQSQSRLQPRAPNHYSTHTFDDCDDLKFHYKYKAPAGVQRRQFVTMAAWAGHETTLAGIEEFATSVESWTQAARREFLKEFYEAREAWLGVEISAIQRRTNEESEGTEVKVEMKNDPEEPKEVVKQEHHEKVKRDLDAEAIRIGTDEEEEDEL